MIRLLLVLTNLSLMGWLVTHYQCVWPYVGIFDLAAVAIIFLFISLGCHSPKWPNFRNQYRAIQDDRDGSFRVQIRRWWIPIWFTCWQPWRGHWYNGNEHEPVEECQKFAKRHRGKTYVVDVDL